MSEWTQAAREELERYLSRARTSLGETESETAEVIEDLRRHVEEEVGAAGLKVVTEADVSRITTRLGTPTSDARSEVGGSPPVLKKEATPGRLRCQRGWRMGCLMFFGVI
ncbi:MAG TPA: hypothetical protein PK256_21765, partial [Verrucomicrobiota bacterium]|nr:hypothetical protein [Verrucomicrobiota bacterium]